jgi:hypothetical protein
MSDVPAGHLRYREIDIPARFIRQATEHIAHTQVRYVTFMFTGEMTEDAICIGVTTRLMLTDQRPKAAPNPAPITATLSEATVLDTVRQHGPMSSQQVSDALGIARGDETKRAKVRRFLSDLVTAKAVRPTGPERYPKYVVTNATMPLRKSRRRRMKRKDITRDIVVEKLRSGQSTSKAIGDALGIPRPDNLVRAKITEIIGQLIATGRVRTTSLTSHGGRVYELLDEVGAMQ